VTRVVGIRCFIGVGVPSFYWIWFFTREPVGELSLYFFSCITLICFYFELNIYGRLPTIPTKIVPRKKVKGRHWKDEISALTSVSLGASGDLLLGLQKSAVVTTFLKSAPSISLYEGYSMLLISYYTQAFFVCRSKLDIYNSTQKTARKNYSSYGLVIFSEAVFLLHCQSTKFSLKCQVYFDKKKLSCNYK
jgi:hypothetical protein